MRKYLNTSVIAVLMTYGTVVLAQDSIVGKYSGSFTGQNGTPVGVELVVDSVEAGTVKGTATRYQRGKGSACRGEYPMEGRLDGNVLTMKTTEKQGAAGDCNFRIKAVVEGNKLIGTTIRDAPIELSR